MPIFVCEKVKGQTETTTSVFVMWFIQESASHQSYHFFVIKIFPNVQKIARKLVRYPGKVTVTCREQTPISQ